LNYSAKVLNSNCLDVKKLECMIEKRDDDVMRASVLLNYLT
jgi:hypothetical protein